LISERKSERINAKANRPEFEKELDCLKKDSKKMLELINQRQEQLLKPIDRGDINQLETQIQMSRAEIRLKRGYFITSEDRVVINRKIKENLNKHFTPHVVEQDKTAKENDLNNSRATLEVDLYRTQPAKSTDEKSDDTRETQ
jgi:hypothetical protein